MAQRVHIMSIVRRLKHVYKAVHHFYFTYTVVYWHKCSSSDSMVDNLIGQSVWAVCFLFFLETQSSIRQKIAKTHQRAQYALRVKLAIKVS